MGLFSRTEGDDETEDNDAIEADAKDFYGGELPDWWDDWDEDDD
jgi:hypothetical protein